MKIDLYKTKKKKNNDDDKEKITNKFENYDIL